MIQKNKKNYWDYQMRLGQEYLVPFIQKAGFSLHGATVLDLGCAEGGVLAALAANAATAIGLEISISRIKHAIQFARQNYNSSIQFVAGDLFFLPLKPNQFDMIIILDVLEHLPDKEHALANISQLMTSDTLLLVTFPPFYSPFGGHQQMLQSIWRFVPYFHALPTLLWRLVAKTINKMDKNRNFLHEMENLRKHRLTIGRIKKIIAQLGLKIIAADYHIIRPNHKLRYGWPIIGAGFCRKIPCLNELLVSGVTLLLKKK